MARTGGSVAVVDVDPRNGSDIEKTRQLLDSLTMRIFAEIATPSGGRHFYIAGHPELPSCSNLNGWPGIDVLSFGKLVFLRGTLRPKYGGRGYQIVFDSLEALADGGDPDSAETFADWVAEHRTGQREQFSESAPWAGGQPDALQAAYPQKILDGIHRDLSAMGEDSGRNSAVYNAGLKCGNFMAGAGLDGNKATVTLIDASTRNGLVRSDGECSVLASIESGIKMGKRNPGSTAPKRPVRRHLVAQGRAVGKRVNTWCGCTARQRRSRRHTWEELFAPEIRKELNTLKFRETARLQLAQEKTGTVEMPRPTGWTSSWPSRAKKSGISSRICGTKDGKVLRAAHYKAKSTLRDNAVRCLADGGHFLGKFDTTPVTDGTIVVIDLELSADMMREWLRDQGIQNQSNVRVIPMRGKAHSLNLTLPDVRTKCAKFLIDLGISALLLDCMRPILDALNLSEDKDTGELLAGLDAMLTEAGITDAMVIHHIGHNGERARGDSAILGWADSLWKMVRKDDDPDSQRYFSAFGRDVDVPESEVSYDATTRALTIIGGSRKQTATEHALYVIGKHIKEHPDLSQTAVIKPFGKDQDGYKVIASAPCGVQSGWTSTAGNCLPRTLRR